MAKSRRDTLISVAAKLLDRGGPQGVTLREVGRLAGVSHNAPYNHFADKHALLAAVASRELRRETARAGGDRVRAKPQSLMTGYVRWAMRHPERFKLTFGRWTKDNAELKSEAMRARGLLIEAVVAAQAVGDLPSGEPERLASLLWALAHGAADLALAGHLPASGKGRVSAEDLVKDLFNYMRGQPRRGGRSTA
jgi:AcrR family transcriptional regulator